MRSLWVRLTAGLVVLLAASWLVVGLATAVELRSFLTGRLDQQLQDAGGRFPASLEHGRTGPGTGDRPDTRGQSEGTFGARLLDGKVVQEAVVHGNTHVTADLDDHDRAALALSSPGNIRTISLSELGEYRVLTTRGHDGDVLVTGLPKEPVDIIAHRLLIIEGILFVLVLAVAGAAAAGWVRLSLRPLRRVATIATGVADLPLSGGEVALSQRVPDAGGDSEVGRLGTAFNRMLGHIENSLALRQAGQERLRRFAADASHELRTPVAAIRGHAELALRSTEETPEDVRHAMRRIQAEAARMGDLVDDLLLLARLDTGRPLAAEPVDLTRLVLDATSDARVAGPDHHWRLDLPEDPVEITGDGHRLHQAIANLLANARQHTPPASTVTVALTTGPGRVVVTVSDDGPGIPADLQSGIFDRFVRADHGRSRAEGGTGLGLAIAHGIITVHHGTLTLDSRPGRTVFRLDLPRPTGDGPATAGSARPPAQPAGSG